MQRNSDFKNLILQGIPNEIPKKQEFDININRAPLRKKILNSDEKKLALLNALRYFPKICMPSLLVSF